LHRQGDFDDGEILHSHGEKGFERRNVTEPPVGRKLVVVVSGLSVVSFWCLPDGSKDVCWTCATDAIASPAAVIGDKRQRWSTEANFFMVEQTSCEHSA
jgi:hypothetical protein